jgi:ribosomal protein S18 acetylase RimI-like enzyme
LAEPIRLRKILDGFSAVAKPLVGKQLVPLWRSDPTALHHLLVIAYAKGGGSIGTFDEWFWPLVEDDEFHPDLIIIAADQSGQPVGLAQCWTSGFLKDLVVHPDWRDKGLGSFLLHRAFAVNQARGLTHMDLKVLADNHRAQRFYARHGMVEVG